MVELAHVEEVPSEQDVQEHCDEDVEEKGDLDDGVAPSELHAEASFSNTFNGSGANIPSRKRIFVDSAILSCAAQVAIAIGDHP